jgi:hypothetical protein
MYDSSILGVPDCVQLRLLLTGKLQILASLSRSIPEDGGPYFMKARVMLVDGRSSIFFDIIGVVQRTSRAVYARAPFDGIDDVIKEAQERVDGLITWPNGDWYLHYQEQTNRTPHQLLSQLEINNPAIILSSRARRSFRGASLGSPVIKQRRVLVSVATACCSLLVSHGCMDEMEVKQYKLALCL